jgi:myo-inositol catabolism protein IolC/nucleotide-binding universal stress UspA family protein
MTIGYEKDLYILAFDHRGSFEKMVGGPAEKIQDAKHLIWEGFQRALDHGAPADAAGILVDAQYGDAVAREAHQRGVIFAMPVEKSGQNEFDFEYGEQFGAKIEEYDPTFSKVLVRYNPEGDAELNRRQSERLRRLSDWLHERDRRFLFELLVPAEPHQLEAVGGDEDRYDEEVRPRLMMQAIQELQQFGVEPDVWKIEGIEDREACRRIAELVRRDGRDHVSCVVLGRGASDAKVDAWLRAGAGLPGYIGFAIGRSIFGDAIKAFAAGQGERDELAEGIARNHLRFIDVYRSAAGLSVSRRGGIVVGVDGSEQSQRALAWAVGEARLRQAAVEVVQVWEPPPLALSGSGFAPGLAPLPVDVAEYSETLNAVEEAAAAIPERLLAELGGEAEGVEIRTSIVQGSPADVLVDASGRAELLVVGSHGHGGRIAELVLGSVSRDVLHRARCPVVVVPARQSASE